MIDKTTGRDKTNTPRPAAESRREKASDVMTPNPQTVTEKQTIREAARLMVDKDCGALPVVGENGRKVMGMITDRDIVVRLIAEGRDPSSSHVSDAMSRNARTVGEDMPLNQVMEMMSQEQVRRLPVVDHNGGLVGIVALADIANQGRDEKKLGQAVSSISEPGGKHAQ
jgi:CBS domain-containing protein